MTLCSYFEIWRKRIPSRVHSSPGEESHHEIKVPYCTHAQSPVTLETAQHGLGEGRILKCGGSIRRCPLPEGIKPRLEQKRPVKLEGLTPKAGQEAAPAAASARTMGKRA